MDRANVDGWQSGFRHARQRPLVVLPGEEPAAAEEPVLGFRNHHDLEFAELMESIETTLATGEITQEDLQHVLQVADEVLGEDMHAPRTMRQTSTGRVLMVVSP